jgi:hypothetical protein
MPLPEKMVHGRLRQANEPSDVYKQHVAVRRPLQFRIYVAGSRAYNEEINRPKFIEKGFNCSRGFFAFHKINAPDECAGAAVSSYLFQKIHPSGREGKPPALTAQFDRQSFAYSG